MSPLFRRLVIAVSCLIPLAAGAQPVEYRIETATANLSDRFGESEIAILEKINRADRRHLQRLEELIVPDTFDLDSLAYSPLPGRLPALAGAPKALVVHQPYQVFGAYESGELVRWGPVSTGRRQHPTPSGFFHLNWRSPGRTSTEDPDWYMEWYFNFHNRRGLALHEFALPGEPASHACVRLLETDAMWIYDWGEQWTLDERGHNVLEPGTPLWIVGDYDFGAPPPWLDEENPHAAVTIDESVLQH